MKITKRALSWLLALAMVIAALPLGTVSAAADTADGYGRGILARMENAKALLYMYDLIAEASQGTPDNIQLTHDTYKISWDELCTVYDLMLSDHPEIFWHGTSYSGSLRSDGSAASLKPSYTITGSALTAAKAALEAEVVRLTADLMDKSDYEKSRILHDRLAGETVYVQQGEHQTAYGALVQGTAVCAGYTRAYQLLMQRVGIPIWYVTGESLSPSGSVVPHAWNLVLLDGEWYYTDVTWDDQTKYTFYAYLNTTTAQITEDHTFGNYAEYLPTATATANNYFVRNDRQMPQMDVAAVADIIRNDSPARVYITGDKAAFIKAYGTCLLDICNALNAPAGSISYGHATLGREVILQLNIEHTCQYVTQTVDATCNTDGYTAQVCSYEFCHNEQNRTVIPATGAHTYDHACDADCNACGATRQVSDHIYDNACDTDCNVCGAIRTAVDHVYDNACDADCNICGATRTAGDHVYDNTCDADCNICGAARDITHTYTDDELTCGVCGTTRAIASVEVTTLPNQTRYEVGGEALDLTGGTVTVRYSDGTQRQMPLTDATVSGFDNTAAGDCVVTVSYGEYTTTFTVQIVEPGSHIPGDVNGDGKVNVRDLGLLQQSLNGWDVTIIQEAADVNGDGKVNVRDLGLLQQYLNGWDVELK